MPPNNDEEVFKIIITEYQDGSWGGEAFGPPMKVGDFVPPIPAAIKSITGLKKEAHVRKELMKAIKERKKYMRRNTPKKSREITIPINQVKDEY